MRYEGGCHCGNLKVRFETALDAGRVPLRACGCTFCRRHGATWTSDPAGSLEVRVGDPQLLSRYRFGLGTSEFLLCRRCGVPVAAVCELDGATYAALNANALDDRGRLTQAPLPVDYDGETAEDRLARRRRAWTPARVG
ncbi:GFA family protein [Anaeromyxobacter paludicola]|uniref:CENP-V/GFA domain-containing protein n=1 Tax=Anaeromyxobacter paludicola TaxID=2918171 RepID=A0ABM7XE21_9BACT|nr:hypothetical protein [Anaeromyxobacter paludicola]BDG10141.1 hypothetical protein AMPC_32540 [Anaeromyxobacter paludicola]